MIPEQVLNAICCPGCGGDLVLGLSKPVRHKQSTTLDCVACDKGYPVMNDKVPVLLIARAKKRWQPTPAKT